MQALKLDDQHLPSIFNLACNLEQLKDYAQAKRWFEHAIKIKSDWIDALYGLTLACIRLEQPAEAVRHISKANELAGKDAAVHLKYVLAVAYRDNLQWDLASEAYQKVMKDEKSILAYREMIQAQNEKLIANNLTDDFSQVHLQIDLYSHFKDIGLERKYAFDIDLMPFYCP